jgi:hypothetical protein
VYSRLVKDYFTLRETKGEVGIEIEMEGTALGFGPEAAPVWSLKGDGSLRGESVEYVLRSPVPRSMVAKSLELLQSSLKKARLSPSDRCGVHVHVNVQQLTISQLVSFITLYTIFEEVLVKFCGPLREGNYFCLRAKDAEYIIDKFAEYIEQGDISGVGRDSFRYAALNLSSIPKFGSLEFRSMRTEKDFRIINTWVEMLLRIKDFAIRFKHPSEIISAVSLEDQKISSIKLWGIIRKF